MDFWGAKEQKAVVAFSPEHQNEASVCLFFTTGGARIHALVSSRKNK